MQGLGRSAGSIHILPLQIVVFVGLFHEDLAGAAAGWDSYAPEHPLQNDRCGRRRFRVGSPGPKFPSG